MQRIQSTEKQENNNNNNKSKAEREHSWPKKKKKKQQRVCRGSAADMETFSPPSQKADRIATYSATLSDLLPTWFQLDCKGNPRSNGKAAFKAKSATRCSRCPHLRATGKCRPSIKHKTKMHYHLVYHGWTTPEEKETFRQRLSDSSLAWTNSVCLTGCKD